MLAVSRRWNEPDHGIWEIRKPPRQHLYSKVMCWVTVDRAISIAEQFLDREPTAWTELRNRIAHDVLTNGWNDQRGTFSAAYGSDDIDASVLAIGLWGLLPPDDERFVSTVAAVERDLRKGSTVYRYLVDDGLPGSEGGFNLMTSWLIDALTLLGRTDEALALFRDLCAVAGATGLMAEELDPEAHRGRQRPAGLQPPGAHQQRPEPRAGPGLSQPGTSGSSGYRSTARTACSHWARRAAAFFCATAWASMTAWRRAWSS